MADEDHAFSIILYSHEYVRNLYLKDKKNAVFLEGLLGSIEEIRFVEDVMLVIKGKNGEFSIDIEKDQVLDALIGKKQYKPI